MWSLRIIFNFSLSLSSESDWKFLSIFPSDIFPNVTPASPALPSTLVETLLILLLEHWSFPPSQTHFPQCHQRAISEMRITYPDDLLELSIIVNECHVFNNSYDNTIRYILLLSPFYEKNTETQRDGVISKSHTVHKVVKPDPYLLLILAWLKNLS